MFVNPFISIFCEPEPARFAEKHKEIPYEDVSRNYSQPFALFFCAGICCQNQTKFNLLVPLAQLAEHFDLTKISDWNPWFYSRQRHHVLFFLAGSPPVGGGNFVNFIRKKLVMKNQELHKKNSVVWRG